MRNRLYRECTKRGLTQEQVAIVAKVTRTGYNHIESGNRDPSWTVAQRLEHYFGISASILLADSENVS